MKCLSSNIIRITLFFLVLILNASVIHAQTPLFKNLEVLPRISETRINHLRQDSLGYLWLGSDKGLFRFDGIAYEEISLPENLRNVMVTALEVDPQTVIAGFDNGTLVILNRASKTVEWTEDLAESPITCILRADASTIFVGTNGNGIVRISDTNLTRYNASQGLADDYVHCLSISGNELAIGTDLGLSLSNIDDSEITFRNFDTEDGLTDNLILSLTNHGEDNLLIGMQNGSICNFNLNSNRVDAIPNLVETESSPVKKILRIQNEFIILTESSSAYLISWQDLSHVHNFQLIDDKSNLLSPLDGILDREGNLLLTFGDNRLTVADIGLQFIRDHDGEQFSDAQCLMTDRSGNIWFANTKGIFKHEGEFASDQFIEKIFSRPKNMSSIVAICEGENNDIWFGTFGSGIGRIDLRTGKTTVYSEKDGLANNNVLSMAYHDGKLWMATLAGACTLNLKDKKPEFHYFDSASGLTSNYIYSVYSDSQGRLWLGTDGAGLVKYENGEFEHLKKQFPDAGKSIISITEDRSHNIWFYSTDKGLQWTDLKKLVNVNLNTAREKVDLFAIHNDPFGNVVAITSHGIAVLNEKTDKFNYAHSGFPINVNYLNVIARDIQGRIWIGTQDAMIRYSEFNIGQEVQPRVNIESIEVMLLPFDTTKHRFEHFENHFTFHLSSIWLRDPESVSYKYKLIGYDVNWVVTKERSIIFSQLNPGRYTFMVKASATDDWDKAEIRYYTFEILPPYWQTTWFYSGIFLLFLFTAWLIFRIRVRSLRQREAIAREKVQTQFDTLRNQINPHFLFNSFNTLISIISSDQKSAVHYVEKLSDYFRVVLEQREKDVITIKEELALVHSYLYLQKQRFASNLQVSIHLDQEVMNTLIPPLTLQLLVENAIKHNVISRAKPLTIEISQDGDRIIIANNIQEKITKEASTGIGLENIRHRYKILFSKEISILNDGNKFVVSLPVVKD